MAKRKYIKHPLSYISGGCKVTIVKLNGSTNTVTWVKYPEQYIEEILTINDILIEHGCATNGNTTCKIYLNDELVWSIDSEGCSVSETNSTTLKDI